MNEYKAKIESVANDVAGIRSTSGNTSTTLMFGLLALMRAKNKITDKDLDIVFEIEKSQASSTLDSYFEKNYGDPNFSIQNESELKDAEKLLHSYVDNMKNYVTEAAKEINPPREKKPKEK